MRKLGKKELRIHLQNPLDRLPKALSDFGLELSEDGSELVYSYDSQEEHTGIARLLRQLNQHGIDFKDLQSRQSSLEDIFVSLVGVRS